MTRIIFFGTPDYVICVPEALKEAGYEIAAVVTQPPKPVGRKQVITPSPVETWAEQNKIKIISQDRNDLASLIRIIKADLGVVAAFGKIISQETLDLFAQGVLNIHPSLLPKYRGAAPIQAAIFYGDKKTGVSIIKMDAQMDHGPILSQSKFKITDEDTFESLCIKSFEIGAQELIEVLPNYLDLNSTLKLMPQDESEATYTWKTSETKEKAHFLLENAPNLEALDRMSRAFYPWPGAWTEWNGKIVKFLPGKRVQLEGKKPVTWKQFKEGYPDFPLELI